MDTNSFVIYIKTDDIYKDIAKDVETRFDTWNYELEFNSIERPFKRWIRWENNDSYLIDDGGEDKKAKGTEKCVIKRKLKFENLEVRNLELLRSNSTWE